MGIHCVGGVETTGAQFEGHAWRSWVEIRCRTWFTRRAFGVANRYHMAASSCLYVDSIVSYSSHYDNNQTCSLHASEFESLSSKILISTACAPRSITAAITLFRNSQLTASPKCKVERFDRLLDGESISSRHIVQSSCSLELVDLLLAIAQLLQVTVELALVLGTLLAAADGLVHTGRTADEDLDGLALLGLGQNGLQELLGDVALAALPLLRRVVQDVEGAETAGVCVLELLEFALHQNVLLSQVAVDQGNLGLVVGVLEDGPGGLPHGSDASSASN